MMNRGGRLTAALIVLCLAVYSQAVTPSSAARLTADRSSSLQQDFRQAAREFRVPEAVLLAISYNETRWEQHGGAPSTSGGYGVMHLTDVPDRSLDDRGDGSRGILNSGYSALHTLPAAARLLGLPPSTVRYSVRQNIRGGAALLASLARRVLGHIPRSLAEWYGPTAAYSGSSYAPTALGFANAVFGSIRHGESRVTFDRQRVTLAASPVSPDRFMVKALHLQQASTGPVDCPAGIVCRFVPAAYHVNNPSDPSDYGNYDAANRPNDGLTIRYVVIHDTEGAVTGAIGRFQDPTQYASSNYVIRSSDGLVTEMVRPRNVAWHAGNYWFNMHAIGIEHEGVAVKGATWYSEPMYQASAALVRYLARRYNIPLDRSHIIGHDQVPGYTPQTQSQQHWDPGPFWDWQHYMSLLHAPITSTPGDGRILTISPSFAANQPPVTYCFTAGDCRPLPTQPASFVPLYTQPSLDAPLAGDLALHGDSQAGTTLANDWGDQAAAGEELYLEQTQGDWDQIDYGGKQVWLYNPQQDTTAVATSGSLVSAVVTPREGLQSIPVFGRPYVEASAYPHAIKPDKIVPLQYTIPAGQSYVATDLVRSDFYWSPTQTRHRLVTGQTMYYQIFFNHRLAFVRAADVDVTASVR